MSASGFQPTKQDSKADTSSSSNASNTDRRNNRPPKPRGKITSYQRLNFGARKFIDSKPVSKKEEKPKQVEEPTSDSNESKDASAAAASSTAASATQPTAVKRKRSESGSDEDDPSTWFSINQPDRSKSDFYCEICDSHMNSEQMWGSHITGKRHLKNIKKQSEEPPSKIKSVKSDIPAKLYAELDDVTDPVVGLDYICELQRSDPIIDPTYTCYLCYGTFTPLTIIDHILTTKHRMNYLKVTEESGYALIESMELKKGPLDAVVYEHAVQLEKKKGRGEIEVKLEKPKKIPSVPTKKVAVENDPIPPFDSVYPSSRVPANDDYPESSNWRPIVNDYHHGQDQAKPEWNNAKLEPGIIRGPAYRPEIAMRSDELDMRCQLRPRLESGFGPKFDVPRRSDFLSDPFLLERELALRAEYESRLKLSLQSERNLRPSMNFIPGPGLKTVRETRPVPLDDIYPDRRLSRSRSPHREDRRRSRSRSPHKEGRRRSRSRSPLRGRSNFKSSHDGEQSEPRAINRKQRISSEPSHPPKMSDADFINAARLLGKTAKLQLLKELSRPEITNDDDVQIVTSSVNTLSQIVMQYKIRSLPIDIQMKLAKEVLFPDKRESSVSNSCPVAVSVAAPVTLSSGPHPGAAVYATSIQSNPQPTTSHPVAPGAGVQGSPNVGTSMEALFATVNAIIKQNSIPANVSTVGKQPLPVEASAVVNTQPIYTAANPVNTQPIYTAANSVNTQPIYTTTKTQPAYTATNKQPVYTAANVISTQSAYAGVNVQQPVYTAVDIASTESVYAAANVSMPVYTDANVNARAVNNTQPTYAAANVNARAKTQPAYTASRSSYAAANVQQSVYTSANANAHADTQPAYTASRYSYTTAKVQQSEYTSNISTLADTRSEYTASQSSYTTAKAQQSVYTSTNVNTHADTRPAYTAAQSAYTSISARQPAYTTANVNAQADTRSAYTAAQSGYTSVSARQPAYTAANVNAQADTRSAYAVAQSAYTSVSARQPAYTAANVNAQADTRPAYTAAQSAYTPVNTRQPAYTAANVNARAGNTHPNYTAANARATHTQSVYTAASAGNQQSAYTSTNASALNAQSVYASRNAQSAYNVPTATLNAPSTSVKDPSGVKPQPTFGGAPTFPTMLASQRRK